MSDTPSARIVGAAQRTEVITDARGRKLTIRNLNALDQTRLLRAVGPAQAGNQPYFHMVECAAMVANIDDVPCLLPTNERQIDAAIGRLDDEGMAAIMVWRTVKMQEAMKAAEDAVEVGEAPPSPLGPSAP